MVQTGSRRVADAGAPGQSAGTGAAAAPPAAASSAAAASGLATSGPATSGPATSGPATSGPATSGPATSGLATAGLASSVAAEVGASAVTYRATANLRVTPPASSTTSSGIAETSATPGCPSASSRPRTTRQPTSCRPEVPR